MVKTLCRPPYGRKAEFATPKYTFRDMDIKLVFKESETTFDLPQLPKRNLDRLPALGRDVSS